MHKILIKQVNAEFKTALLTYIVYYPSFGAVVYVCAHFTAMILRTIYRFTLRFTSKRKKKIKIHECFPVANTVKILLIFVLCLYFTHKSLFTTEGRLSKASGGR